VKKNECSGFDAAVGAQKRRARRAGSASDLRRGQKICDLLRRFFRVN
jgi:hypothetical protein